VKSCVLKHLFLERVEQPKISPKYPGNAFFDALLMSCFQNLAADAAAASAAKKALHAVLIDSFVNSLIRINSGPNILRNCFLHWTLELFDRVVGLATGPAGAAFAARAAVLVSVGVAAGLVGAKAASVETAPATDGSASAPAEAKAVPVGRFALLKPGGKAAVFADAEAAPVEKPSAHKVEGALAASTSCTTAPGDRSAA
jgi:hypothetical protein